jgi:hypothetical protein
VTGHPESDPEGRFFAVVIPVSDDPEQLAVARRIHSARTGSA